jgi:hypothetical protein
MNLTSTLVGFGLIWIWQGQYSRLDRLQFVLIPAAWALSVAIEGGVLVLINRDGGRQNWVASLAANTASYLLLLAQTVAVS